MDRLNLSRGALRVCVAATLLSGCGGSHPPVGAPGALPQVSALATRGDSANFKIVYSFRGGSDGADPFAGLIDVGGTLYGTTVAGGTYSCGSTFNSNCGTVFSVTPGGTEKVLHSFGAQGDGRVPEAGLIELQGTLYGTTAGGGSHECYVSYSPPVYCGTVFSITPSGTEKVLLSFGGGDGAQPYAGLIAVKGTLYGTTQQGGKSRCYVRFACGTVFSVTTAGTESVLHSFSGHPDDGASPYADLIDVKNTLYGTTWSGGKHNDGTVFSITMGGAEKVLHSFGAGSDGRNPFPGLIEYHGMLYGTTTAGGAYCSSCGTVFSITPGGVEKVLHSFGYGADGKYPQASLIELKGMLYGTTLNGGSHSCGSNTGCGTAISITPSGAEKVLHNFGVAGDSAFPRGGLIDVNGTLYGTSAGGSYGFGTVFSLKP